MQNGVSSCTGRGFVFAERKINKERGKQIMFERIYPEAISWLSIAAFIPLSGLLGNSVSKSGHWQPLSIITTNPIDVSLECVGLFLGGKLGTKNSFKKMCSLQSLILLKEKHTAIQMSVLVNLTKYVKNSEECPLSLYFCCPSVRC